MLAHTRQNPSNLQSYNPTHAIQLLYRQQNNTFKYLIIITVHIWAQMADPSSPWMIIPNFLAMPPFPPRGTQHLVAATQTAMDEAVDRFASYADGGVPLFGGECAVRWVGSIQPWRDGDPQYMDGPTLLLLCVCVCIFYRYRRSQVRSPIEWGSNTDSIGSRRRGESGQSMRTRGGRLSPSAAVTRWECVRTHWHRAYSSSEEREYEHGNVREVLLSSASCPFLARGLSSLLLPGSVSMMGCSPLEEVEGPSARAARPLLCRFGDVTHRANHYATRMDRSS